MDERGGAVNPELEARMDRLAVLGDPGRRTLFRYVTRQVEPVTREEAARANEIPRHVAKFHLDRLVDEGLLTADYRRPPGRGGPGAGRPAKLYRAGADIDVSVPERRYDIAGRLLVRAVGEASRTGASVSDTLIDVAHGAGRDLAAESAPSDQRRWGATRHLLSVLTSCGLEPDRSRRAITLQNCPFHRLAAEDREVVCGMNLAFVRGLLEGSGMDESRASLEPVPGGCCVRVATGAAPS